MKKFVILTFAILSCNTCFASVNTQLLDKIEESVFGYTYSEENETSRLNRIEENVYGKISAGNTQSRILKLKKDLAADLMGQ